jgi:hypothetical protein
MPIPKPEKNEDKSKFIQRCMSNDTMRKEYPDNTQRMAVCVSQTQNKQSSSILSSVLEILSFSIDQNCEECGFEEVLTASNLIIPEEKDYVDFGEKTEDYDVSAIAKTRYQYIDPDTREVYYFDQKRNYKKNNRYLRYVGESKAAEYQGRKVTLNKPFRTPDAKKKFAVYVRKPNGKVVIVRFGSQEMSIKRDDPKRRKSFRARHGCDNPGPKYKAKFWSCFQWRANSPVKD